MKTNKTLQQIKSLKQLPFNYQYLEVFFSANDASQTKEKNHSPVIRVEAYHTTNFQVVAHHKPISKIANIDPLANHLSS
ncbi:hypothetical protein BKI52_14800 [marine bacterium AO1-C]|nr:hypothetical protein BKI52_14800 [marine bacterium AO1-C]